jgi:sec-independent protein translocase protein TatA
MESLGMPELLVILGVAVLLFGGKKIPELAKGLGEGIRNFKTSLKGEPEKADEPEKPGEAVKPAAAIEAGKV